ncbi:MAG: hypothetical protein SFY70_06470 [Bacteroidia bacterium]|nr:hypothetical protein [Bacteroidia bacterium]
MAGVVEVIQFVVTKHREQFIRDRPLIDAYLHSVTPGFKGSELLEAAGNKFYLLVYWEDEGTVVAAQAFTENAPDVKAWAGLADQFLAFDTAVVRHSSR